MDVLILKVKLYRDKDTLVGCVDPWGIINMPLKVIVDPLGIIDIPPRQDCAEILKRSFK